ITLHSDTNESLINSTNLAVNEVYNWLCSNRLSLNINKSKIIKYNWYKTNESYERVKIHKLHCKNYTDCDCDYLEFVEQYKYLGVMIDQKLSWSCHVNYIANKLRICNVMLYKLKYAANIK